MTGEETCNGRAFKTYHVQHITMPVVKMLIKVLFFVETLFAVSTFPFIYISLDLVLFVVSEQVIVRVQPTSCRDVVPLFLYKRRQILQ